MTFGTPAKAGAATPSAKTVRTSRNFQAIRIGSLPLGVCRPPRDRGGAVEPGAGGCGALVAGVSRSKHKYKASLAKGEEISALWRAYFDPVEMEVQENGGTLRQVFFFG